MRRYFIKLSYKGTHYCGWQVQENAVTVQQKLNEVLSVLLQKPIDTVGCGRTDTGVHATHFYAHFDAEVSFESQEELLYRMNKILPKDIAVLDIIPVTENAHARFDAIKRTYKYYISKTKNPFLQDTAWYFTQDLDLKAMNAAAQQLFKYTDFSAFSKSNTQTKTNNCKIYEAEWTLLDDNLIFTICADRFLRNMVRAIVGTLIEVGTAKITIDQFCKIIEAKDRTKAGQSAPAEGLFLEKIEYPRTLFLT